MVRSCAAPGFSLVVNLSGKRLTVKKDSLGLTAVPLIENLVQFNSQLNRDLIDTHRGALHELLSLVLKWKNAFFLVHCVANTPTRLKEVVLILIIITITSTISININTIVTPITFDHYCSINATQSNSLASHCRVKFAGHYFHFIMIHIIIIIITITV